jgi:hypothetical protein
LLKTLNILENIAVAIFKEIVMDRKRAVEYLGLRRKEN